MLQLGNAVRDALRHTAVL
ncbi:hypothetical protein DA456_24390 [Pseudomonas syringae pv. atrofaciens]|uniref:Uncharacterized protein n=1 Tax=Pseudomonas syringae pv. atrofaciens TaxID=192087 RepID=A0AAD0MYH1_PSESX|nr:hypothetical protein DA456_24390 [Pseudomonas syringae pv. atrofaciens]